MESSIMGAKGSDEASDLGSEVGSLVFFWLGFRVLRWDPQNGARLDLYGYLVVVRVEDGPSHCQIPTGIITATSCSPCHPSRFPPCL